MKILAVDPGLRKIGLAVSDPTGTAARALTVLEHISIARDSARIIEAAESEQAERILVGSSHEPGNRMDQQTHFTHKLLAALRSSASIPVDLYDESFSTQRAQEVRRLRADRRKVRRRADDSLAAAAFLQEYLDAQVESSN
jgi:putative Holliday junction resolvase